MGALESAASVKAEAASSAHDAAMAEHGAIAAAKGSIRRLRNAVPRVPRKADIPGVHAATFHVGTTRGRSTPLISKYLADIREAVVEDLNRAAKHAWGGQPRPRSRTRHGRCADGAALRAARRRSL